MIPAKQCDVAIIGGGLAGLATSILLGRQGHRVVLLEKETYPFHKVCGEYISLESWPFLESLGLPLSDMQLPIIKKLMLTAPGGKSFFTSLPQGGFGISRFQLDHRLAELAREQGVEVLEGTRVREVSGDGPFELLCDQSGLQLTVKATLCCAAYGKRSQLDLRWKRDFTAAKDKRLNNYVGVKYHIRTTWPDDLIGLHNFEGGYCGLSRVENGTYNLCYLTEARMLRQCGSSLEQLQQQVLGRNPHLKKILDDMEIMPGFPVTISQISFQSKSKLEQGVLMLGDAAGMITPLCGNGMSIALHTAKLAAACMHGFLTGALSKKMMEAQYTALWEKNFADRLSRGRRLQRFFGSAGMSDLFVGAFKTFPFLAKPVVKMTHGKPF